MRRIKLGLIKGRHEMPVNDYVIKQDGVPANMLSVKGFSLLTAFIEGVVDRVVYDDYPGIEEVELYLTGLSRVQHLVIKAFIERGVKVFLYDYDKENDNYFVISEY